jgi:hypothetical protein
MRKFPPIATRPRHLARPSAIATPIGVAISIVSAASFELCRTALCRVGSCSTDRSGSLTYQRKEKPCQVLRERPALKENSTAIATGTMAHARNNQE